MDAILQRLVLTGLALAPAIVLMVSPVLTASASLGILLGGAGSVYALVTSIRSRRPASNAKDRPFGLLRRPNRLSRHGLPSVAKMKEHLAAVMVRGTETVLPGTPLNRDAATAAVLERVLRLQQHYSLDGLSRTALTELYLLQQVLNADKGETGRLAQLFRRPDLVLDIRAEVDQVAETRARFDRGMAAFQTTWDLWSRLTQDQMSGALKDQLQALDSPDIDLWHHIVVTHAPDNPQQREAALWCLRQPGCDRATIAVFLAGLADTSQLVDAATTGDQSYLDAVHKIIKAWNAGTYKVQELSLDPQDVLVGQAARFSDMLDALAQSTNTQRWADPHGAFVPHSGRAIRARSSWTIQAGGLARAPTLLDYVDPDPHT